MLRQVQSLRGEAWSNAQGQQVHKSNLPRHMPRTNISNLKFRPLQIQILFVHLGF